MVAIERDNRSLKGILPKDYARPALDKQRLGELIDLIANIGLGDAENRSKDILGRVYEYFLGQFASAEGKKGGQFYTPRCIVQLLVAMLAPYKGGFSTHAMAPVVCSYRAINSSRLMVDGPAISAFMARNPTPHMEVGQNEPGHQRYR